MSDAGEEARLAALRDVGRVGGAGAAAPKSSGAARMAAEAAARVERARSVGQQLDLLGAPAEAEVVDDDGARKVGRPKGSRNKDKAELGKWLAAKGWALPDEGLARLAGLDQAERDPILAVIERVEQVLAWAGGAVTPARREALFLALLKERRMAAAELMAFVHAKRTPDVVDNRSVTVNMPAPAPAPAAPGDQARIVEGVAEAWPASKFRPPPRPGEAQALEEGEA